MTSPISLLAMLGGATAEPAAPAPAQGEDAAIFAAALVAALQQLQAPPVKVAAPAPQPQNQSEFAEGEILEDEVAEGELAEGEKSAATLGQLLGKAELSSDEVETAEVPPGPVSQADGYADSADSKVDLISDEPALPTGSSSKAKGSEHTEPEAPKSETVAASAAKPETAPVASHQPESEAEPAEPSRRMGEAKTDPRPIHGQPRARSPEEPMIAPAPGKSRTANKGPVLVGEWSPPPAAFTGWKPPVESPKAPEKAGEKKEPAETTVDQTQPVPMPAPIASLPVAVAMPMPAPQPVSPDMPDQAETPARSTPVAATPIDQTPELDSSDPVVRQTQVANARLAAQLAELVGEQNVTEFRVELSKARREGRAEKPETVSTPDEAVTPAAPEPRVKAPLVAKGEELDQPLPLSKPVKSEMPIRIERQNVTANRLLDLSDAPRIAEPLRAAREAAGPIVPVLRKEIPAAPPPESKREPVQPEKPRAREQAPSESAAAGSNAAQGRAEPVTNKNEASAPRESREARNLPQESSGNDRPAGSADRVTVQVSDAEGRQTRIRVSVLGDQVRAVIVPPDSESARQLEQRMDDLQTALARQGFASSKVSVQQAGESAVQPSATLAGMASGGESKAAPPGREQPADEQRQGRGQREQQQHPGDGHRHPNGRSRDQSSQHRRRHSDL